MISNASVTVWTETVDPKTRTELFSVQCFDGVSLQKDVMTELTDGGIRSANVLKIRIPTTETLSIRNGDKLTPYRSEADVPPEQDCYTVMIVSDNRKGSESVWHWKVIAK